LTKSYFVIVAALFPADHQALYFQVKIAARNPGGLLSKTISQTLTFLLPVFVAITMATPFQQLRAMSALAATKATIEVRSAKTSASGSALASDSASTSPSSTAAAAASGSQSNASAASYTGTAEAAQLDHVRLLSSDADLADRADIDSLHKYIGTTTSTIQSFFTSYKRGKQFGLSVTCNLVPGNKALYLLEVRPVERQDAKMAVALTDALEKIKVPAVTGPVNLQILMKVWYPKIEGATFFKKGFELQKADKNKEAIQQYSQALALDPFHVEAYTCRGMAYNSLGQYDKAIADLTKAISMGSTAAYLMRAYAYKHLKDTDKAMSDCNRAIELDPHYWEGYVSRGELWLDKKDYAAAFKDGQQALQCMPTCGYGFLIRGQAHLGLQEYDEAASDLTTAIEILAKSADAYHFRALAYKNLNKPEEAASDDKRAAELGYAAPAPAAVPVSTP